MQEFQSPVYPTDLEEDTSPFPHRGPDLHPGSQPEVQFAEADPDGSFEVDLRPLPGFEEDVENPFAETPQVEGSEGQQEAAPNLGVVLDAEFESNKNLRREHEDRWLRDLRQVKGQYDPDVEAMLNADPNRARTYIRLTKVKVRTVLSRMMDLLFPMSGQLNWDVVPSPNADLPPQVMQQVAMEKSQEMGGVMPGPGDMQHAVQAEAEQRALDMRMEISDQLAEKPGRMGYQAVIRSVIRSALAYGTGVLKGPLVQKRDRKRWVQSFKLDIAGGHVPTWDIAEGDEDYQPFYEAVPIWDIYPDATAVHLSNCRFIWQTHLMTRSELSELAGKDYFDAEAVREYILDNPTGDAQMESHESDVRRIAEENIPSNLKDRYRLKERWGMLTGEDLADAGMELPEADQHKEYWSNVWLLGDKVIKAAIEPVRGVELPYYFYHYDKDETSIWGEGICADIRDPQSAFNATIRKVLDQYAISGPMFGMNMAALAPGEDPRDIYPNKVFAFEGAEDMDKVMKLWVIPSFSQDGMNMATFLQNFADEVTMPRFMHSDNPLGGAGATASGLSMLLSQANINLKGLVKQFDDDITTPFIKAMFHWNMQFNPKEHIKGDFVTVAKGSTALMAREVLAEKLINASSLLSNQNFAPWIKEDELLKQLMQAMEVRPDLIRTEEEHAQKMQQMMELEAEANAKAMLKESMNEARARGMQPEQALAQVLQQSALAMQQQGGRAIQDASQRQPHVQPPPGM